MRQDLVELLRCPVTGAPVALDELDASGGEVTTGILTAGGERYPVVAGVPVMLPGLHRAVHLIEVGDPSRAAAAALHPQLAGSRLGRAAAAARSLRPGRLSTMLRDEDERRLAAIVGRCLEDTLDDPLAIVELAFTWGAPNPEAVAYFGHRFGTPRHLVSLATADAVALPDDAAVLDLGCGIGHLAWGLAEPGRIRHRVLGVDLSLAEVWAARAIAPHLDFVCGDATRLPLPAGRFDLVASSDVLSFIHDKAAAAREARRMLAPGGTLMLSSVKSTGGAHVYAGMPLSPDGWRRLVAPMPHLLMADRSILERYFAEAPLPVDDPGDVERAPTVTLLATVATELPLERDKPTDQPHARGPLGVNPLLERSTHPGEEAVFRRRFPTPTFAEDNPPIRDYLPATIDIPRAAVRGDRLDPSLVAHLTPTTSVLALPRALRRRSLAPWATRDDR